MLLRGTILCLSIIFINAAEKTHSAPEKKTFFLPPLLNSRPSTTVSTNTKPQPLHSQSHIPLSNKSHSLYINLNSSMGKTYRVKKSKEACFVLSHNLQPLGTKQPQDAPGFPDLWINLGERFLDACRQGDLPGMKAALLLGKEKGLTVNSSHNGHYPLGEVFTEECTYFLLTEKANPYLKHPEKSYTVTNIHLSKLFFYLNNEPTESFHGSKATQIINEKKVIMILANHITEEEKNKLCKYWKTALHKYKKFYGCLNYTEELPDDNAFLSLINTLLYSKII
ncbi:hypothetical protein K9K77_01705 [Candidatus Babeliales bacterium]|nr:hypothetical protein [Candidatus Babeliales bacterium]